MKQSKSKNWNAAVLCAWGHMGALFTFFFSLLFFCFSYYNWSEIIGRDVMISLQLFQLFFSWQIQQKKKSPNIQQHLFTVVGYNTTYEMFYHNLTAYYECVNINECGVWTQKIFLLTCHDSNCRLSVYNLIRHTCSCPCVFFFFFFEPEGLLVVVKVTLHTIINGKFLLIRLSLDVLIKYKVKYK